MTETANTAGRGSAATRIRAAKHRRRLVINILVAVVIVAIAVGFFLLRRAQPTQLEGLVPANVERMNLTQEISATGSITPQTGAEVKIGSQITGRIKKLHADVGSKVVAGQVIAELDLPELRAQVQQAEATLALNQARLNEQLAGVSLQGTQTSSEIKQAQAGVALAQTSLRQVQQSADAQIATAEAQIRLARANAANSAANLKRVQQLFEEGYVAAADVDNARAQAEVNNAQLASAEENLQLVRTKVNADPQSAQEQLRQAEATLATARAGTAQIPIKSQQVIQAREAVRQSAAALALQQAQYAKSLIMTPISGTVLQLEQQEGETIAAGLSAPTLIIVADLDRLQADAFVDETDIGQVAIGQRAKVTVDAYPNRVFWGRVAKIASGSTMQQNVVTYDVTIALENSGQLLKPDMTATVDITVAEKNGVLAVPVDALKQTTAGYTVTVMNRGRDGKLTFKVVPVKIGISNGDHTEVLSGLQEGQTVVLSGQVPGMNTEQGGPRFGGPFLGAPRGGGRGGGGQGGRGGGR